MLNITCNAACYALNTTERCGMFPGCQWFNTTDMDPTGTLVGQCGPNAKESYGESGWKGILMALLGNIVIK